MAERFPMQDQGGVGLTPNPSQLEQGHILFLCSGTREDRQIVQTMHLGLDNNKYIVQEEATTFNPGDHAYKELFLTCAMRMQKIISLVTPSCFSSNKEKFDTEIDLIEAVTQRKGRKVLIMILKDVQYDALPLRLRVGIAARDRHDCLIIGQDSFDMNLVRLIDEIKVLSPTTTNQGVALANGHYINYQLRILPGLEQRLREAYHAQQQGQEKRWDCSLSAYLCPKHVCFVPVNAEFHDKFEEYDPNVSPLRYADSTDPVQVDYYQNVGGFMKKSYSSCMSKVLNNGKEYIVNLEMPSTLRTLTRMQELRLYGFDKDHEAINREVSEFLNQLVTLAHETFSQQVPAGIESMIIVRYDGSKSLAAAVAESIECDRQMNRTF